MSYKYKKKRLSKGITKDEHRLVMENYLGRKLDEFELVHHINEDPTDNQIENLELCTRSSHARFHQNGRELPYKFLHHDKPSYRGSDAPHSKLIEENIPFIRQLLSNHVSERKIARMFGVSRGTIHDIKRGKAWNHVIIVNAHPKQQSFPLEIV